jgi:hypothetical protein
MIRAPTARPPWAHRPVTGVHLVGPVLGGVLAAVVHDRFVERVAAP